MASRRNIEHMMAELEDSQLQRVAEDTNAFAVFSYLAPTEQSASILHESLAASPDVEAVETQPDSDLEVWLVLAFVSSPGSSRSARGACLAGLKDLAAAHGCLFLGWRAHDHAELMPNGGEPDDLPQAKH